MWFNMWTFIVIYFAGWQVKYLSYIYVDKVGKLFNCDFTYWQLMPVKLQNE